MTERETCNFIVDGQPCGLRAAVRIGIVLHPANILTYAIEIGLPAYSCLLHEDQIDEARFLQPAILDSYVEYAHTNFPETIDNPVVPENCQVVKYILPLGERDV